MSLDIEKQPLSTLREWTKQLGIKGTSTMRKPDLVDLLTRVGEDRIQYILKKQEQAREEAAAESKEVAPEAKEAAPEVKEAAPEVKEAASDKKAALTARQEAAYNKKTVKNISAEAPAEDNSEISGVPDEEKKRPNLRKKYNNINFSTNNRVAGRGGFGTYSASYRAQMEEKEKERESAAPERPPLRSPDEELVRRFSRLRSVPREKESPAAEPVTESPVSRMVSEYIEGEDDFAPEENENLIAPDQIAGEKAEGILEIMPEGYGFIRSDNYLPGDDDVYVYTAQNQKFRLKTGDSVAGQAKHRSEGDKYPAMIFIERINGDPVNVSQSRKPFEDLTPVFPYERIHLETQPEERAMRLVDLLAPIGKGQRGMIVSQPKAGKTTLLKAVAKAVQLNHPEIHIIMLLIDERPEEVTDIKESIEGENVEVIYSTFDELPEHHKRVAEMVLGRAQRLVEHGRDVMILLDSITRLARAYNLTVTPSGRTLSGGLDPAALHMPKKFFGAARKMREGGSLTILATALVETGSRLDDMVFEEFKGTGNMELVLDRRLSERRIFPAIDLLKSGTRRDDLLLDAEEADAVNSMRQGLQNSARSDEAVESILDLMRHTRTNREFCALIKKKRF